MGEMAETALRSFLSQYKDVVSIKTDESYKLVTISNTGIISLRQIVQGRDIKSDKVYRIKTGSFIYSRLAAHTGSFGLVPPELDGAVVSGEMPVFKINYNIILPHYFQHLLHQRKFLNILYQLTKGMGRVRIKEEALLGINLSIHKDVTQQKRVAESIHLKFNLIDNSTNAYSDQISYLENMRQAFLKEAIEGKLTAKWRDEHPELVSGENHASKLLEKIRIEKVRLIKEGKIKKEKPLTPVANNEKPFALPEGWVWCRFGEIARHVVDCPHATPTYLDHGKTCLRASNITPQGLRFAEKRFVSLEEYTIRTERLRPEKYDLVYIREGGRLGIAGLIDTDEFCCLGQRLMLMRFFERDSALFSAYYINSPMVYKKALQISSGSASPHINVRDVIASAFPLPPIAEQQAIVERMNKLMSMIDDLEKQLSERKDLSEKLMQAVLREAFAEGD